MHAGIPGPARPQATILVVDDEADVRESTCMLLASLGHRAVAVADPGEVVETAIRERPQAILQDLKMHGLNLAGLVAALRTHDETAGIPLVFFSASADLPAVANRHGAWSYLAKPFRPQELSRLLERVLVPRPDEPAKDPVRQLRQEFHDQWNNLAALGTWLEVLRGSGPLPPGAQRALAGLDDALLRLEARTERLRAVMVALADAGPEAGRVAVRHEARTPEAGEAEA